MAKSMLIAMILAATAGVAIAAPSVDGKVAAGEYPDSAKVMGGGAALYWAWDASGGLSVAFSLKNGGWLAVGLGSKYMDESYLFMGAADGAGNQSFIEQTGAGHRHSDSAARRADASAVNSSNGVMTLEFHVPAARLPKSGKTLPFIVACSSSPSFSSKHRDFDVGTIPAP